MAKGERAHDPSAERGGPVWERVGVEGGEVISLSGRSRVGRGRMQKAQENEREREREREKKSEGALARRNQYGEVEQSTIASEERRFTGASLILFHARAHAHKCVT